MLLGNKVDKPGKVVTTDMGKEWAATNGFGFMEVSAKTGLGIQAAFEAIVTTMHNTATGGKAGAGGTEVESTAVATTDNTQKAAV